MTTQWTPKQRQAIDSRGKNLLVSAAAGSGKTAVLVERIVNLMIEQRVGIDELLIVTFTNAASAEMKDRIQRKLREKRDLMIGTQDRELIEFLTKQIQNVPRAMISTVHSFCIKILRDHFTLAEIDPAFKLLNESQGAILREKALELAMEQSYREADGGFSALVDSYSEARGDHAIRKMLLTIDRFIQAQSEPEEWLNRQIELYRSLGGASSVDEVMRILSAHPMGMGLQEDIKEQLEIAQDAIEAALDKARSLGSDLSFEPNLLEERIRISELAELLEQGLAAFCAGARYGELKRFTKKKADGIEDEDWEEIKALRNEAKEIYVRLTKDNPLLNAKYLTEDLSYLAGIVEALIRLVLLYRSHYAMLKTEKAVLDFSDLEHLSLEVLKHESAAQSLRAQYKYIFYDEYQDTNMVQEEIIRAICRENNLFFVGDVKQSIYRFRLADPTIFNQKYHRYTKDENSERIDLSNNFRSRREILSFCNLIFGEIMTVAYGEVDYKDISHQLIAGRSEGFEPYRDHIELAIIEKAKTKHLLTEEKDSSAGEEKDGSENEASDAADGASEDAKAIELEALYTASKIKQLHSQGVQYNQIAVLMRSLKDKAAAFEKAFTENGIPYYVDYHTGSFDKLEIKCLLDYLRIVDNKNQDEALLGAMSSVFGGFDEEELIAIRKKYRKNAFYVAAENYANYERDELSDKLREFYRSLADAVRREKMTELSDFIRHIVEQSGFWSYVGSLENAAQRMHNIRELIERAKEYDRSEALGLFGFLRHVDSVLKSKGDTQSSSIIESENAVTVMTIHKSKGLEFNTVFVCDLGKKINETDLSADLILHNEMGIALRYKNSELGVRSDNMLRMAIRAQKKRENLSEEIRILYVALTRAVDRLYLVGTVSDVQKLADELTNGTVTKNIVKSKNYLSWIANVLIRERKGEQLRGAASRSLPITLNDPEAQYTIGIYEPSKLKNAEQAAEIHRKELLEHLKAHPLSESGRRRLERYADFEYPYQDEIRRPSKVSVTELTKSYQRTQEEQIEYQAMRQPDFSKNAGYSAAQVGTIVHFVLEHLEIRRYTLDELKNRIQAMVDKELLTPQEAEVVRLEPLRDFFDSELGKRMIASGRVKREQSFLMKTGKDLIEGIIDCYFEEADGLVLVDYKTDALIDDEKHKEQLGYYKQAIEAMEGKKVKQAYIYWIRHDRFSELRI